MDRPELLDHVRRLREQGKSPKEIARALGLPPSKVAPLVRALAAERSASAGDQEEVVGCWVNAGWSRGLSVDQSRDWSDDAPLPNGTEGMATVILARRHRWDKVSVCAYLVDIYCLGIKNTSGPDLMDEYALRRFRSRIYEPYPDGWQDVDLAFAQHLVFGAVDYARTLGFAPAVDFGAAAAHLGVWKGPSAITFGQNGRPYYTSGPYDDARHVMKTLERTVGPDNFGFLVEEDLSPFGRMVQSA